MATPLMKFLVVLLLVASGVFAQDARVNQIEKGLRPAFVIEGQPEPRWSIEERMAHYSVPGVSVAVIENGKIAWAKGYGVLQVGEKQPVTVETLFQAASISKPVAALATLRLVAQGKLSLDEDVNLKLRKWKVPAHQYRKPVTLRGIMSHSAGLTVHGFRGYARGEAVPSLVNVLNGESPANSAAVRVDIEPGSQWRYSGGGYSVMQQLVEDVTGEPFAAVVKRLVLDPAAMRHSTYEQPLPPRFHDVAARGHLASGKMVTGEWHTYPEQAAAGLWTTPSDLATILIQMQKAAAGDQALLPAAIFREMSKFQSKSYGLGWGLSGSGGNLGVGHGGSNAGFKCEAFAYLGRGQGAVVMTNGDRGAQLGAEIFRAIAAAYGWPDRKVEIRKTADSQADKMAELRGGRFLHPTR